MYDLIHFIPLEEYSSNLKKVEQLINDCNDVDFLALANKLNIPLWSNDKELQKQSTIIVLSTKDLFSLNLFYDVLCFN